jgi:hypothetical protein
MPLLAPEKYLNVLREIKQRMRVIDAFMAGTTHAVFEATNIETVCLQFRKILELVAFSSLIANVKEYSQQYDKFAEHWNARSMLRDLERVNPDFYPQPIVQEPTTESGAVMRWLERPDDYLTKHRFIGVYEKCGGLMHAENPYAPARDYEYYKQQLKPWRNQTINLLNAHTVTLSGESNLYLFQMGAPDANPTYHLFGLVTPTPPDTV